MPAELDPAWEYHTADPEIEELLSEAAGRSTFDTWDAIRTCPVRQLDRPPLFQRGVWHSFVCARPGCGRVYRSLCESSLYCSPSCAHPASLRVCDYCGRHYRRRRGGRRYCSVECFHSGQGRASCAECGDPFTRRWPAQVYCRPNCAWAVAARRVTISRFRPRPGTSTMTIAQAQASVRSGTPFGDVFPALSEADQAALREWYVREPGLPNRAARRSASSPVPVRAAGCTGDVCTACGGVRMTRNGACLRCEDCGGTSGCG